MEVMNSSWPSVERQSHIDRSEIEEAAKKVDSVAQPDLFPPYFSYSEAADE